MPRGASAMESERVLIHAPYGRDAALIHSELAAAGFSPFICKSIGEICSAFDEGAGAALIGDEALRAGMENDHGVKVGYNGAEGAVNSKGAIFGLEMCYLFAPVILVWAGGAMFFGYKLDSKRHAEIRRALAEPDFLASEEALVGMPVDAAEQSRAAAT